MYIIFQITSSLLYRVIVYGKEIDLLISLLCVVNTTFNEDSAILTKSLSVESLCQKIAVLTLLHYSLSADGDF